MPITTMGSYAPTMQEFINHWQSVNATLGSKPLTLKGDYAVDAFSADRVAIVNAINRVIGHGNVAVTASGDLAALKPTVRQRVIQFRRWVLGYLPGTGYARSLPDTPAMTSVESRFLDPLQAALNLWTTIDADAALTEVALPITLAGNYTAASFRADLDAVRAGYVALKDAQENDTLGRKQRDTLFRPAEQRMKQYRDIILARFDADSPFVRSLPALSPPPGTTPAPVEATGEWEPIAGRALLAWTPSTNPNLERYSVRACAGTTYKTAHEFIVADLPPDTLSLQTLTGLATPGSKAVYRVFVVVASANERGSNDVALTRPEA